MITLKDLAKKLDVSVSTVSKALNDSPEISEETVSRVIALAKYYNYTPNKNALSLKNRETKTIGVIIPNILNRFFAKVLFGIQEEATHLGYNIIVCISNESIDKEKESLQLLSNGSVDGFILAVSEETQLIADHEHFEALLKADLPMVMFDRVLENIHCDKVIIDDIDASFKAVSTLIQKGRKKIAFISTITDLNVGKLREKGYHKAIIDTFNSYDASLVLNISKDHDAQEQIRTFIIKNKSIDGIIAADNISGTMAISVASSLGISCPEDLSVIGFADNAISNLSVPKLSTLDQNAKKIGKSALNLLVNRIGNKSESADYKTEIISTEVISNGSD